MFVRGLAGAADDSKMMQQMGMSGLAGEAMQQIERIHNYGFSSVHLPANEGGEQGGSDPLSAAGWGAEHIMAFMGGNRSHGLSLGVDDRRHRPRGLQPGESFQYDDQGQGTYIKRGGTFMIGGGQNQQAFASVRHVTKQKQPFPQSGGGGSGGSGGGGGGSSGGGQSQQSQYNHEGDSPSSELQTQDGKFIGTAQNLVRHYIGDFAHNVANDHVSLTKGNTALWIDKDGNIYSSKPIQTKPYPYQDQGQVMQPQSGGGGGGGGGGGISCDDLDDFPRRPSVFELAAFGAGLAMRRASIGLMFVGAVILTNALTAPLHLDVAAIQIAGLFH